MGIVEEIEEYQDTNEDQLEQKISLLEDLYKGKDMTHKRKRKVQQIREEHQKKAKKLKKVFAALDMKLKRKYIEKEIEAVKDPALDIHTVE